MSSLTGEWIKNSKKGSSQQELLKAMGRPAWQIKLIDDTEEYFTLRFFMDAKDQPVMYKKVKLHVASKFFNLIRQIFPTAFSDIEYEHTFQCNGKKEHHPDDKKQFGECDSISSLHGDNTFIIRWYLTCGLLKATHTVQKNEITCELRLETPTRTVITATKVYDRVSR